MSDVGGGGEPRGDAAFGAVLARVSDLGSAAQASIPGLYAWAVTVAPAAWSRGASLAAKGLAILGVLALATGFAIERRWPRVARPLSVWGLAVPSALVWMLTPSALTPVRLEVMRGIAGMLGWALFAFASAAPAVRRDAASSERIVEGAPLRPRTRLPRGDLIFMGTGVLFACALQTIGWRAAGPERAVLVRLVALACGLTILGAATSIAVARHGRRLPTPRKDRLREGLPWLALLLALVSSGVVVHYVLR